jgi:hypothetical protein
METLKKGRFIFLKLFLSYSVILLFPLVLFGLIYGTTTRALTEKTISNYKTSVALGSNLIYRTIQDIKTIAESVFYDNNVKSFLNTKDFSEERIYDLYILRNALSNFQFYSSIAHMCLYSEINNYLLTTGGAAPLIDTFFQVSSFTGMSYAEWKEFARNNPMNDFYLFPQGERNESSSLVYLMRLNSGMSNLGNYLLIHVDTSILRENLMQITEQTAGGGFSFLLTPQNELVCFYNAGINEEESRTLINAHLNQEKTVPAHYLAVESEDRNGWTLVSFIPQNAVTGSVRLLVQQIIYLSAGILLAGLILCYLLTRNKAHTLIRIMASITQKFPSSPRESRNEYTLIEQGLEKLVKANDSYQFQSIEQKQKLRHELFSRLLLGQYNSIEQITVLLDYTSFSSSSYKYAVIMAEDEQNTPPPPQSDRIL